MSLDDELVDAIAETIRTGGLDDDEILAEIRERVARELAMADRMRAEARTVACCCATPAEIVGGRCSRCWGWPS